MENKLGINYQQAQELLNDNIQDNIIKMHMVETEAIMRALASRFNENEDEWGTIGLLHDIDWEKTKNNPSQHCVKAVDILKEAGASEYLINSIISHAYANEFIPEYKNKFRETKLEYCLVAAETLTGLIIASALVQPDKKLASVQIKSLKKKFKQKSFAANCNRDIIMECEKAGINIDDFLTIGLKALQNISSKLGL